MGNELAAPYRRYFTAVCEISTCYRLNGRYTDARWLLDQAMRVAADQAADEPAQARLLVALGALQVSQDQFTEAVTTLNQARRQLAAQPQDPAYSSALRWLGEAYYMLKLLRNEGDYDRVLELYERALALREQGEEAAAIADALFYVGIAWERKGEPETAVSYYRRAYDLAQSVDDKLTMSYAIRHLGFHHWRHEELGQTWACLNESLALRQEIGFRFGQVFAHAILSRFLRTERHDLDGARKHAESALQIAQALEHQTALSGAWLQLAAWHKANDEPKRALGCYENALAAAAAVGNDYFSRAAQAGIDQLRDGGDR